MNEEDLNYYRDLYLWLFNNGYGSLVIEFEKECTEDEPQ